MTSKCEVSYLRGDVKRWYEASVGEVKHENGRRLLFIEVRGRWTDVSSASQLCHDLFVLLSLVGLY